MNRELSTMDLIKIHMRLDIGDLHSIDLLRNALLKRVEEKDYLQDYDQELIDQYLKWSAEKLGYS